jgi:hypothetical protein
MIHLSELDIRHRINLLIIWGKKNKIRQSGIQLLVCTYISSSAFLGDISVERSTDILKEYLDISYGGPL